MLKITKGKKIIELNDQINVSAHMDEAALVHVSGAGDASLFVLQCSFRSSKIGLFFIASSLY